MTSKAPRSRSRGLKTWSAFGNLGRRPTEYEVLTHNMNHTRGAVPLEMGPDVHGNVWLREHRDSMKLTVDDWDAFRDPDTVTYGSYVADQDDQETYVENLIAQFDSESSDEKLADEALTLLLRAMTPTRYVAHSQQMLSAYVQQLAMSSYVGNCAAFQTADQLRRVQLTAYRTTQLQLTHPERGFGTAEKKLWTEHPDWQPIRAAFEWALVEFDWDRAFVAINLVTMAIADQLFLVQLGRQTARVGARLDALVLENLWRDSQRSQRWSAALVNFLVAADPGNLDVLQGHVNEWAARGHEMIEAGARIIATPSGASADGIATAVRRDWHSSLKRLGLRAEAN
ncbi:isoprene monooxygenase oxygenase subunit beta [Rhodococcus sp. WS1]|uniref:isoprene monooxygenase oxygenase subunit beta n=1 Tax=unclassified Rhodococcus (in: high G+C Gram-positive bacteria) TaxID=192944 RepID=UPI001142E661|nr:MULTISPECIES: isoprene monooxygenase oxygenase subunit beta [unclassified Rhodococcus (in: high G+C Gram-positive bacteria)]ROZ52962.1 isoprene monooxygenase oxygenase subunit beta [Rhodococcus sp. WS1]TQC36055.1 isoprene monooxygenase oxygenase subunit beta [Rhodococcus sp. WS7]